MHPVLLFQVSNVGDCCDDDGIWEHTTLGCETIYSSRAVRRTSERVVSGATVQYGDSGSGPADLSWFRSLVAGQKNGRSVCVTFRQRPPPCIQRASMYSVLCRLLHCDMDMDDFPPPGVGKITIL